MTKYVVSVDMQDAVERVEAILNERNLSTVPVADKEGIIFGIISLSDIEHFRAAKKNPKAVRAWEMCTYRPIQVGPDTPVAEVARLMVQNKIHHVVVTQDRAVKGIVSSLDLVQQYLLERPA